MKRTAIVAAAIAVIMLATGMVISRRKTENPVPQTQAQAVEKQTKITVEITQSTFAPTTAPQSGTTSQTVNRLTTSSFSVSDPKNTRGLSTKKIAHSYGGSKNGVPHEISVESQAFFDKNGYDAITLDTKSADKVLYLTFDCGYENGYTAKILDVLAEKNVKAAFFCTLPDIKSEPERTRRIIDEGHILGNHSSTHPSFAEIGREKMAKEIKGFDDYVRENFNYSAPFFRFPKGEYSESALELVNSLGYKCVFWSVAYADWDTANQKGADYAFEKITTRLHPGAVILMHSVSADNAAALGDIIDKAIEQGYEFKPLTALPG